MTEIRNCSEPANERSAAVLSRSSPEGCEDFLKVGSALGGFGRAAPEDSRAPFDGLMPLPRRDGNLLTLASTIVESAETLLPRLTLLPKSSANVRLTLLLNLWTNRKLSPI